MNDFRTMDAMWKNAVDSVIDGHEVDSRAGMTRESLGWCGRLVEPKHNWLWCPRRNLKPVYAAAELLWYLSGDDAFISTYAPSYEQFMENGRAHGAYGPRWAEVWTGVLNALHVRNSRQCVMLTWRKDDIYRVGRTADLPCTIALQFIRRRDHLHCIATMRSNDVWLGMPYDVWCFSSLQKTLAAYLNVNVGWYQHQVGSMHVYDKDLHKIEEANLPYGVIPRDDTVYFDDMKLAVEYERHCRMGLPHTAGLPRPGLFGECAALIGLHHGKEAPPWLDPRLDPR